jgi:response regulator RpfG family c-di-GMP phosphodiesterase
MAELPSILCVDDEPNLLQSMALSLRRHFKVTTASSGHEGLEKLASDGPFAVVVSDMQMPSMDGPTFLANVRNMAPDVVRVVLTGRSDRDAAIEAVNLGHIFRFLCKPCPTDTLVETLAFAVDQHRLLTAERVLLEDTLRGSIRVLTNILSISQPAAFGRSSRILGYVRALGEQIGAPVDWRLECAAMLAPLGCVTLPPETAERLYFGEDLDASERAMAERIPEETERLLRDIPRLEGVLELLACARRSFEPMAGEPKGRNGDDLPLGARILRLATDYEELEARGDPSSKGMATLESRAGVYDPALLEALGEVTGTETASARVEELALDEIEPGMILVDDMRGRDGRLLLARGREVTREVVARLQNLTARDRVDHVRVSVPIPQGRKPGPR